MKGRPKGKKNLSKRGKNLSGNSPHHHTGLQAKSESVEGKAWKFSQKTPRITVNSNTESVLEEKTQLLSALLDKKDFEISSLLREAEKMEIEMSSLERSASLRNSAREPPSEKEEPHYIPQYYSHSHNGERNGRALNLSTLRTVASICASGQQYEKFQLQRFLNEEPAVAETTFYRNAKFCWWAAKEVFKDYQLDLVSKMMDSKKV